MNTIKIKCNECGVEFGKSIYEIKRKQKIGKDKFFCSLKCGGVYQQKRKQENKINIYISNPKKCVCCYSNLIFTKRKNKFCSHRCSSIFNNKNRILIKNCVSCNKQFNPHRGNVGKFCSHQCSADFKKQKVIDLIKSGNYKSIQCQTLKKFLIETRGYKCESCRLSDWLNQKIVLTLEHIDGDSTNNKLDNVQLLCWNCHSLTPTFGSKNKNGTRCWRRKRYLPVSFNGKMPSS